MIFAPLTYNSERSAIGFPCLRYTADMKSVVDDHREDERCAQAAMTANERVALALELGDQDLEIFRRARGLSEEQALCDLRRYRQAGRVPCSFFEVER